MYIIMLGAPGSGKGTIGTEICDEFNLVHVATGDIFREEMKNQTELVKKAEEYISQGKLVPDEVTVGMVKSKLDKLENVLLDGFPRTIDQAKALEEYLKEKGKKITAVIDLEVPDQDIIKRTSSRVICSNKECGASYNTVFMPPKVEGICDECGSTLIQRPDDSEETIKNRLSVYYEKTKPVLDYYEAQNIVKNVDGIGEINEIFEKIKKELGEF